MTTGEGYRRGILATILGLLGWHGLQEAIRRRVDEKVAERSEHHALEIEGRLRAGLALTIIMLCLNDETEAIKEDPPGLLETAIDQLKASLPILKKAGHERYWTAANNLAYTLALRGQKKDGVQALRLAELIYGNYMRKAATSII